MKRILVATIGIPLLLVAPAATAVGAPDRDEAIHAQRELIAETPGSAALWNDLGSLLASAGEIAEAERSYRRALELAGNDPAARFNLALLLHETGRLEEAIPEYERFLETYPGHAWAHYLLGAIHEVEGRRKPAVAAYSRAFELDRQLLYPDVNPHIVANAHVAEALLRRPGNPDTPTAPRIYTDPRRIENLLANVPESRPSKAAAAPKDSAKKKDDEQRVLDEETLEEVPETNQLEDAGERPQRRRRRPPAG